MDWVKYVILEELSKPPNYFEQILTIFFIIELLTPCFFLISEIKKNNHSKPEIMS